MNLGDASAPSSDPFMMLTLKFFWVPPATPSIPPMAFVLRFRLMLAVPLLPVLAVVRTVGVGPRDDVRGLLPLLSSTALVAATACAVGAGGCCGCRRPIPVNDFDKVGESEGTGFPEHNLKLRMRMSRSDSLQSQTNNIVALG